MQKVFLVLVLCSMLVSGCGTFEVYVETTPVGESVVPGAAVAATAAPGLSLSSSSDEIQLAMLESAAQWKSIWMDGMVTDFAVDESDSKTTTREQVWIDLTTNRFRVLSGSVDGEAQQFLTSDGMTILRMDLETGESTSQPMPEFVKPGPFVPALDPGHAYPQPLWGQMGTRLSQLAFTSDLAQNEGTFKPVAVERIADREALVVEWTHAESDLPSWRMWLDVETTVILKMQSFDKGGGDTIRSESIVEQVRYDDIFANSLFGVPSSLPRFSDVAGNPLAENEPVPTASSDPDPLNDVYFFISDHNYGNETVQFVRLPGSCVAGLSPCPEAEVISTPFQLKFSLPALVWSPGGNLAALPYPVSPDGNKAGLFVFNPDDQTWDSLAEFNFIDPPLWSPDGERLAFRVQDGEGKDEVYVVHRDGTQLTNLSASEKLPPEGQPYALNGWINNNVILRGRNDMVYLLRVDDGLVHPMFEAPWAKSNFVPSPDGYFLAYMDANDERAVLKLLTPDGNTTRDLIAFEKASFYPIVWSPDGMQLAFAKMTSDLGMGQDLYVIESDGTDLRQVYHSNAASITDVVFSPDGRFLLLQDDDATGRHLFVIDLVTMEQRMVRAPNLAMGWWWLAPSWQK